MYGVEAKTAIRRGYVFGEYVGKHMTCPLNAKELHSVMKSDKSFEITGYMRINGRYSSCCAKIITPTDSKCCLLSLVNTHICTRKHNLIAQQIKGNIFFIAKRDIAKGEELYIHYSDHFNAMLFGNAT